MVGSGSASGSASKPCQSTKFHFLKYLFLSYGTGIYSILILQLSGPVFWQSFLYLWMASSLASSCSLSASCCASFSLADSAEQGRSYLSFESGSIEVEFLDINLTKDSSLLLHAIPSPFYWRILKKIILFSGFKNSYKKICETRKLESIQ